MTLTDAPASTNGTTPAQAATNARMKAEMERVIRVARLRENGYVVTLPSGGTVTLVDPDKVTEREAKAIKVAMMRLAPDGKDIDAEAAVQSGYITVAGLVRTWSLDADVPNLTNVEPLLDLRAKDYRVLENAVADIRAEVFSDFTPGPGDLENPQSPFVGASG